MNHRLILVFLAASKQVSSQDKWCPLLNLSDHDLFDRGVANTIGTYCTVAASGGDTECDYYVKGRPSSAGGNGIPLRADNLLGSGCVVESGGHCWYSGYGYELTSAESDAMCAGDVVANAAAQLRYGILHGYCEDDPAERCSQYRIVDAGSCDTPLWRSACKDAALSLDKNWEGTINVKNMPRGCYVQKGNLRFNKYGESGTNCGTHGLSCVCWVPYRIVDAGSCYIPLTRSTCKDAALSLDKNWGGNINMRNMPRGCYVQKGNLRFNTYGESGTNCGTHGLSCVCQV